jgi:hypothetical protein
VSTVQYRGYCLEENLLIALISSIFFWLTPPRPDAEAFAVEYPISGLVTCGTFASLDDFLETFPRLI